MFIRKYNQTLKNPYRIHNWLQNVWYKRCPDEMRHFQSSDTQQSSATGHYWLISVLLIDRRICSCLTQTKTIWQKWQLENNSSCRALRLMSAFFFYSWLLVNIHTVLQMLLHHLRNCIFNVYAVLYFDNYYLSILCFQSFLIGCS